MAYEIRPVGEGRTKKQSMAELKLRRLTELNARLREDLERRRIPVSEAATELVVALSQIHASLHLLRSVLCYCD